jgi:hypothetical protein
MTPIRHIPRTRTNVTIAAPFRFRSVFVSLTLLLHHSHLDGQMRHG